jgi:hypothetical protein
MKTFTQWFNSQKFKTEFDRLSDEYKDLVVAKYLYSLGHAETYNALRQSISSAVMDNMDRNLEAGA